MAINKKISTTITIGGAISGSLRATVGSTTSMLREVGKAITDVQRGQARLGDSITVFGRMGKSVDGLRARYAETVKTVDALRQAQQRLGKSQQTYDSFKAGAKTVRNVGVGAAVAGSAMVASVVPGIKEAKHYETEQARVAALGMGTDTNAKAFKYVKDMKTFGTSQLENLELMRDAMSVFADLHHAEMVMPTLTKMKFGNKAVFGSERGEQNSQQFMDMLKVIETRGGLKSEAEFNKQANIIQQVISATGGRVSATEWRHMLATGGLAGKGMDSESLFYTMEHLVQEMGGDRAGTGLNSLYKSLYQGVGKAQSYVSLDKLGLIGDRSKVVKHDKTGQSTRINPGALLGSDLFRANPFQWMEQVLLPQLAKKGIKDEKKVIDTIGMIVSNSVGGSFLAEMYRQRENIHRSEARNRGAQNIDQITRQGSESAAGKELDAEAKLADAKLRFGNEILPLYTSALGKASGALQWLNHFVEEHPRLAKGMAVGIVSVGAALIGLGAVLPVVAGGMSLYAAAQLRVTAAAVGAALAAPSAGAAVAATGVAATGAAGGFAALGAAMMATPIGWIVAGLASVVVAGIAIYRYWEPLKAFFVGFGQGVIEGLSPIGQAFSDAFAPAWNIIKPVVMPILDGIWGVFKTIGGVIGEMLTPIDQASSTTAEFAKVGKVCGQVMAEAFRFMLSPIEMVLVSIKWINNNIGGVIDKAGRVGSMIAGGWQALKGAVTGDAPGVPPVAGQGAAPGALPPLRGAAGAAGAPPIQQTNTYHITQLPGESGEQLARRVAEINKRQDAVNRRSALRDE